MFSLIFLLFFIAEHEFSGIFPAALRRTLDPSPELLSLLHYLPFPIHLSDIHGAPSRSGHAEANSFIPYVDFRHDIKLTEKMVQRQKNSSKAVP